MGQLPGATASGLRGTTYARPVNGRPTADRIAEALSAACSAWLALAMADLPSSVADVPAATTPVSRIGGADRLVVDLFEREGQPLVRLARLFVDDRNAAEDLVQEAFIRLVRSEERIRDRAKATAYLRSIVLNLARDHNRRGLVSLRHRLPLDDTRASGEDELALRDDHRMVIEALRCLPHRQRSCLVLRYYQELGIADIAGTLGISANSVKTHLKRGLVAMETRLGPWVASASEDPR